MKRCHNDNFHHHWLQPKSVYTYDAHVCRICTWPSLCLQMSNSTLLITQVIFPKNTHKRHFMAHLYGWLLWVYSLIYILHLPLSPYVTSCYFRPCFKKQAMLGLLLFSAIPPYRNIEFQLGKCYKEVSLHLYDICHQTSNISHTLPGNKIVDHSDVVGASPVGAAPTSSSFSTHMASMDWAKTTASRKEKHLSFRTWCALYQRFDSIYKSDFHCQLSYPMSLPSPPPTHRGHPEWCIVASIWIPCHHA